MPLKKFLVKIYAYHYKMEITITCVEAPQDIENAIVDKLGKGDIKWEHLGEMNDPRVKRITYEEVINGDATTSKRPLHEEEGSGPRMGAGAS